MPAAGWHSEALKFLVSGGVNTVFSWGVYLALNLVLPYKLAYSLAYLCGIGVSYVLQAKWVFRVPLSWRNFMAFPLVYLVQWVLGVVLLTVMVEQLGLPETWAPLAVIVATLPITFAMSRFIIRKGKITPATGHAGPDCDTVKPS